MPSKVDKIPLTRSQDRRSKLSEEQVEDIKELYEKGYTQKEIGLMFGVGQNTIGYIVSPKAKETLKRYRQENPPKRRTKEEARKYQRNLRAYKKDIIKNQKEDF